MKAQRTGKRRTVRWLSRLLLFGVLMAMVLPGTAFADGTDPNQLISNTATIDYDIGGVGQDTLTSDTAEFRVDRKVDLLLTPDTQTFDPVVPNDTEVWPIQLVNEGNDTQGYRLNIVALGGNSFEADQVQIYIDDGSTAGSLDATDSLYSTWAGGVETFSGSENIGDLIKDATLDLLVVADIPGAAADGSSASYYITATTLDAGTTTDTSQDTGAWTPMTVQTVFVDGHGPDPGDTGEPDSAPDGTYSAQVTYTVGGADITAAKSSTVVDDNISGTSPPYKAIPGATVQYSITITNNGSVDAGNVLITDQIPSFTTYVPDSVQIDGVDYDDSDPEVTYTPGSPAVLTVDVDTVTGSGGSKTVTFLVTIN